MIPTKGTKEEILVDLLGDGDTKKMTVYNVYRFREEDTFYRVDWIGANEAESDSFWVRMLIVEGNRRIEICHSSEIMADLGRALCEAASKVDRENIMDLGNFLVEEYRKERERQQAPLWRKLARCFAR